jgi:ribonuclease HI
MIEAWFDGVCEPKNPGGHGAYGVYIRSKHIDWKEGVYVGYGETISNNVAEYSGFIDILRRLKNNFLTKEKIIIRGDSKLVIEQMSGCWKIKKGIYVPLAYEAQKLLRKFRKTTLEWIPRDENEVCDKLAKDVLRKRSIVFKIQPEPKLCQK